VSTLALVYSLKERKKKKKEWNYCSLQQNIQH